MLPLEQEVSSASYEEPQTNIRRKWTPRVSPASRTPLENPDKMRASLILATTLGSAVCLAAPTVDSHHFLLHEKRDGAPHQWTKRTRAHPEEILPVRIGLTQSNLHRAEEFILDVSDPTSPNFGIPLDATRKFAQSNTLTNRKALVS